MKWILGGVQGTDLNYDSEEGIRRSYSSSFMYPPIMPEDRRKMAEGSKISRETREVGHAYALSGPHIPGTNIGVSWFTNAPQRGRMLRYLSILQTSLSLGLARS